MNFLTNLLHLVDNFLRYGGWLVILFMHFYFDSFHEPRMERGKYRKWARRHFPESGHHTIYWIMLLSCIPAVIASGSRWPSHSFWIFIFATDIVDFITGGEDPPWRRWAKSLSERIKLVMAPPPRPAIDLGR